jgi:uracil-DNA glycosylase
MNKIKIHESWYKVLEKEFNKGYFTKIRNVVKREISEYVIYPEPKNIFRAFDETPFDKVKAVILGQDPYINGEADGLAFSIKEGNDLAPSLRNIYREIDMDLHGKLFPIITTELTAWAKQGVLLLNSILTTRKNQSGSHADIGWQEFTDSVISILNERKEKLIFLLWGNYARTKTELIDTKKHLVLEATHPSPLSARKGFFGCRHFSKTNKYLKDHKIKEINWVK